MSLDAGPREGGGTISAWVFATGRIPLSVDRHIYLVIDRAKWAEPSSRCPEGLQHRDMAEPFLRVLVPGLLRLAPGF